MREEKEMRIRKNCSFDIAMLLITPSPERKRAWWW